MANNCWFASISEHTKKTVSFFCAKVNVAPSARENMNLCLVGQQIVFYFLISNGLRLTSSGGTGERLRASSSFYCLFLSLSRKVSCYSKSLCDSCSNDIVLCAHLLPVKLVNELRFETIWRSSTCVFRCEALSLGHRITIENSGAYMT